MEGNDIYFPLLLLMSLARWNRPIKKHTFHMVLMQNTCFMPPGLQQLSRT
jgi:hypothetical protein